ncbi:MAG TPA: response regulator transcription factor [Candidatus Limnocylindria bacterium]
MRRRVLVVEDDRALRQALSFNLAREGYDVAVAVDGESALAAARDRGLDLILLDLMLPAMSGLEVLRVIRREGIGTPVIILSAKGDEIDRVVGLKVGADDYVAKPFSRPELLARIEAVLRRERRAAEVAAGSAGPADVLAFGAVTIDRPHRELVINGEAQHVTTKEFDLLAAMAEHPNRVFTREQLLTRVWGYDFDGDDRTVDVHVSWLRTKLRAAGGRNWFRTVRGVGYAFAPPA